MIGYRPLSRRTFLASAGATVALPFLHSALPRAARAQVAAPQRFLGYYVPNGIHMAGWTPSSEGAAYTLPSLLEPLAGVRDKVMVMSGLANRPARPDGPGDHASGTAAFLTNAHPFKTGGANIQNGISLDQRLAQALGGDTPLPSLQVGIDGGSSAGDCDSGYSCAYARNISWASETTPLPKLTSPRVIFDRLFQGLDPQTSMAESQARARRGRSVLDFLRDDARRLGGKLGATDNQKLDEYLTGLRALEQRVGAVSDAPTCDPGGRPGEDFSYPERVIAISDLMVTAMQCDVTRFATFMLGNAASGRSYSFLGVSAGHHEVSHHGRDAGNLDALARIGRWEVEQLAYLLGRMDAVDEGNGSLLDNTLVFFSSEIEDGDTHSHFNMPIALGGSAGGALPTGEHRAYSNDRSVGELFVSVLQAFGLADTRFGDADQPLPGFIV